MPRKDQNEYNQYMREKMREYRGQKRNEINNKSVNPLIQSVNPINPTVNRKPVNPRFSMVSGAYEDGFWVGICPRCNHHNRLDPKRSFRPESVCEHFQQLETPGTASPLLFKKVRVRINRINVNPLTQGVNPVERSYILSYSRNKYQFVLYSVDTEGRKSLIRSYAKGEKVILGNVQIELTWRPDSEAVKDLQEATER